MKGLAARILPRVVIPTLVAGLLFGLGDWHFSRSATLEKAQADLAEITKVAASFVQEDLGSAERLADSILLLEELQNYFIFKAAAMPDDAENERLSLEGVAVRLVNASADLSSLELFGSSGQRFLAVVDGKRSLVPVNAFEMPWFQAASHSSAWQIEPAGDQLRVSRSHVSAGGLERVVVSITVSTSDVTSRAMNLLQAWRGGTYVELVGASGELLGRAGQSPEEQCLSASQELGDLGAVLVASTGADSFLAILRTEKLATGGLLIVLCGGLAFLLVVAMQRVVVAPLQRLIQLAESISSEGALPPPLGSEAREISILEESLRGAAEESRRSTRDLSEMNQALEVRVAERTSDLERMRDQALEANRAKSQFLANMSHEIRTPMNGVLGMAEILSGTELTEEQASHLDVIRRSGDSLLGVINDILDFSKIEAGKIELEEVDFELVSSVHDVAALLAERAEQKGVELVFDTDPRLPSHVIGDPARIRQVMTNLVGNAIKFTQRGTVQVRVRYHDMAQQLIEFQVKDSGIGIAPEAIDKIFESFSQADVSTTRNFGGTGLGLTISRKLVELMGGELKVTSKVGEGSDFTFILKLGVSRQAARESTAAELLAGRRVLIVDDNRSNRRIFARQFKAIGVETVCVEGGLEAIQELNEEWAEGRSFDFAILDYQMPHMSGVELADRLAPMCERSGMQMVLLSSALVLERGEGKALARRLTKPVRADLLFSTLAGLLPDGTEPLETPPPLPAGPERKIPEEFQHRILLAEDNRVNQMVAKKLLEGLGYQVDVAENGQEALEMATSCTYPVILMDCQMPVLDGYQATGEIKCRLPDQLIIAMTANAMEGDREKCLAAGMDDYVTKPIKKEVLVEVLERYLSRLSGARSERLG